MKTFRRASGTLGLGPTGAAPWRALGDCDHARYCCVMPRFVAFLRGMNLGGRRLGNTELCEAFAALGLPGATAFQASGNVVFDASGSTAALEKRLEAGLEAELGYPVPTFLRTASQIRALAKVDPGWPPPPPGSPAKLQVLFLQKAPAKAGSAVVRRLSTDDDRLSLEGREILWLPLRGVGKSELDMKHLEQAVGITTTRTQGTLQRMATKLLR